MTVWAVTGGTGLVGRFIVEDLLAAGEEVVVLSRARQPDPPFSRPAEVRPFLLDRAAETDLRGVDRLVHCAFDHVPGRYRGGEGDDPEGFRRRNAGGSLALFRAAREAGVGSAVFLSSRAVYGAYPPGTLLAEDLVPRPDTLYGAAKLSAEEGLAGDRAAAGRERRRLRLRQGLRALRNPAAALESAARPSGDAEGRRHLCIHGKEPPWRPRKRAHARSVTCRPLGFSAPGSRRSWPAWPNAMPFR
ncbi:NAD-dependent epimerase/dehydratase family protein [Mangrovicoccus ximenensis]|uniref:NAD-dependent epimerase/dehydratase family protein n=1 Tax=Mangrovicoccus ximenensis TaxID=1911570 RepID=UPI000D38E10C|nr:NAD(P)-dependent oxidoreductase [Mangrovicoccus ximenensis]